MIAWILRLWRRMRLQGRFSDRIDPGPVVWERYQEQFRQRRLLEERRRATRKERMQP